MECYSVTRKKEVLPFATRWVDLECIMLSKSEKDRYCVCDITYLWSLKNQTDGIFYPGYEELRGWKKWTGVGQRVQASSCKLNKFWEANVQHDDYSSQYSII